MAPEGPVRTDNCRPVDTFVPPPLPIQVINITSIDTVNVAHISEDSRDVTVAARSASQLSYQQMAEPIQLHCNRPSLAVLTRHCNIV